MGSTMVFTATTVFGGKVNPLKSDCDADGPAEAIAADQQRFHGPAPEMTEGKDVKVAQDPFPGRAHTIWEGKDTDDEEEKHNQDEAYTKQYVVSRAGTCREKSGTGTGGDPGCSASPTNGKSDRDEGPLENGMHGAGGQSAGWCSRVVRGLVMSFYSDAVCLSALCYVSPRSITHLAKAKYMRLSTVHESNVMVCGL
ncbi:hypothetical protein Z043_101060 [Scleropages formosus]|uniref:Uncharacterized protein n=1 Tax=Scleropages formosus TaxID=113540 RepID=A0A0P7UYQ7_SCLFO|nr:hypothetical protein Z043_101060 [Scleropages formosus]